MCTYGLMCIRYHISCVYDLMCIYILMHIPYHIFRIYMISHILTISHVLTDFLYSDLPIFRSSNLPYDVTPYVSNAVYLSLHGLLWTCTISTAFIIWNLSTIPDVTPTLRRALESKAERRGVIEAEESTGEEMMGESLEGETRRRE